MKTTLADIVLSAQAAAAQAHRLVTAIERQTAKLQAFTVGNFHPDDFQTWENAFNYQLEMLINFTKQPSPATVAAAKATASTPSIPAPAVAS
ncbi:MAG TPA: hypothetical protein VG347_11035 [Verrucomicrobiae bacterium]|nr:hypothetical protein [Verrucomicrobiae bacterium]